MPRVSSSPLSRRSALWSFRTASRPPCPREYPQGFERGGDPYYPINDEKNGALYKKYAEDAAKTPNVLFGGRLAGYKYYDMDDTVAAVFELTDKLK